MMQDVMHRTMDFRHCKQRLSSLLDCLATLNPRPFKTVTVRFEHTERLSSGEKHTTQPLACAARMQLDVTVHAHLANDGVRVDVDTTSLPPHTHVQIGLPNSTINCPFSRLAQ